MKALFAAALLVFTSLAARPVAATSHDPENGKPSSAKAKTTVTRPLVHYLAATLLLSPTQALAVQQALAPRPLQVRTPEEIAARLLPVLTPAEFERYRTLTQDISSYERLHYLALR